MELKETLRAISDDARGWLKAWAGDFTEAEALQPPPGGRTPNPLAWQLGHLACVEEDVARLFSGGAPPEPLVSASLRAARATGAPPPTADTRYLPLAELWALIGRTHERLLGVLEAARLEDLDRPPRDENPYFRSLGQGVYEAALHEKLPRGRDRRAAEGAREAPHRVTAAAAGQCKYIHVCPRGQRRPVAFEPGHGPAGARGRW